MDVHAPHQPVHTWRDFLIHLAIVTIGLFIALMLEALVEHVHQRHLLHSAEANLRAEMLHNRETLATDRTQIAASRQRLTRDLALLDDLRAHRTDEAPPDFDWHWSSMSNAAWNTARDTGALALMPYDHAQEYSEIYGQQGYVNDEAILYIRDIYRSGTPLQGGRTVSQLSPAEIDTMIAGTQQALADLELLDDLSRSLDAIYTSADGTL
jgi:hypothetical protein